MKFSEKKGGRTLQATIIWNSMNTCKTRQFFSLPCKMKPVEEVTLNNLRGKQHQDIKKLKDTSFMH